MLVKAITSFAGDNFSFIPGNIADVPDAIAQSWITHGLAVPADPDSKSQATLTFDPPESSAPPVQTPDPASPESES